MMLSASNHLKEACTQILAGAQGGNKDYRGRGNRVIGVGCRFEMKDDATVDEKNCTVSVKKTVAPQPARKVGGPAEAARCALNDAMLVCSTVQNIDERARNDFHLLSRELLRLDKRVRKDVALLGSGFLMLDTRAREDVVKFDNHARQRMMRIRHIALGLTESASMELSKAVEEHWSDGALDADLRLVDLRARRRAMEDIYAVLEVVKNVGDALVKTLRVRSNKRSQVNVGNVGVSERAAEDSQGFRSYSRNNNSTPDRLTAIQDAYWKMASALVKAEGMECTDPDELEFIVAALLDMEEVDGGNGALLVTESSSSPDVATRLALAGALADAPSLWTLGNAGMSALQRLSKDSNPEVAAAATKAINELKSQWRQPDQLIFPYSQKDDQPRNE